MKTHLTLALLSLAFTSPAALAGEGACGEQVQKLVASDQGEGERFGLSCAIDGDFAVVGEPRDSESAEFSGAAHVYALAPDGWIHHSKLTASDADIWNFFGETVDIQGDTMAITAIGENMNMPDVGRGAVYIFTYNKSKDTWIEQQKIVAPTPISHDFGRSLAIDGERMAISAPLSGEACPDNPNGCGSGSAFVFEFNGDAWMQEQQLLSPDLEQGGQFGHTIDISGETIVVGVRGQDDPPEAFTIGYIFEKEGDRRVEQETLTTEEDWSQLLSGDGTTVTADADTAMVAVLHVIESDKVIGNTENSETHIYHRQDNGNWKLEQVISAQNVEEGDIVGFGNAIDLLGDVAVISATTGTDSGTDGGSAYVYARTNGVWSLQTIVYPENVMSQDVFGFSVDLDSSRVIVGSVWDDDACLPEENPDCNSGSAYIFDISGCLDPAGDLNEDGIVDGEDLGLLLGAWGECDGTPALRAGRDCPADLNADGTVDGSDLGILLGAWTS